MNLDALQLISCYRNLSFHPVKRISYPKIAQGMSNMTFFIICPQAGLVYLNKTKQEINRKQNKLKKKTMLDMWGGKKWQ